MMIVPIVRPFGGGWTYNEGKTSYPKLKACKDAYRVLVGGPLPKVKKELPREELNHLENLLYFYDRVYRTGEPQPELKKELSIPEWLPNSLNTEEGDKKYDRFLWLMKGVYPKHLLSEAVEIDEETWKEVLELRRRDE